MPANATAYEENAMSSSPTSLFVAAALIAAMMLPEAVQADPPSWAPAHGWRKKHDPEYVGYTGHKWPDDYGVVSGRCNYEAAGAVVGGAIGGVVGAKVGENTDNKPVAILVGSVLGAVIGAKIGRDIEQQDRSCIAHSLELVQDRTRVQWANPHTGVQYLLTPKTGFQHEGMQCRNFELRRSSEGRVETSQGKACQTREGRWDLMPS
jgi:surface antigen